MSREIVHEFGFEKLVADESASAGLDADQGFRPFLVLTVSAALLFCYLLAHTP